MLMPLMIGGAERTSRCRSGARSFSPFPFEQKCVRRHRGARPGGGGGAGGRTWRGTGGGGG
ncbi:hypothetical protein, partial [Nocardia abscessus]|uniref:hypothetical protein n=1 Tax=Nocardia abscessus TaxID=120957 RepID=UPI0024578396